MAGRPWVVTGLRVAEREKGWHLRLDRLTSRLSAGAVCVSEGVRRFSDQGGWARPRAALGDPQRRGCRSVSRELEPADRRTLGVTR